MLSQSYYTRIGGKTYVPLSPRRLRRLVLAGLLLPNDRLHTDGDAKTVRAGDIEGLSSPSSAVTDGPPTDRGGQTPARYPEPRGSLTIKTS